MKYRQVGNAFPKSPQNHEVEESGYGSGRGTFTKTAMVFLYYIKDILILVFVQTNGKISLQYSLDAI